MAASPASGPGSPTTGFTAGGSQRIRVSVWAPPAYVTAPSMAAAKNVVDDISLNKTIINDTNTPINAIMDHSVWGDTAYLKQWYDKIIAACHSNNIQCLAGFDLAMAGQATRSRFDSWAIDPSTNDAEIDRFAQSVVDRLNDPFREKGLTLNQPFDGISFDSEAMPTKNRTVADSQKGGVTLSKFYRSVATKLKVGTGNETRVLGVAGGALVDPTHWCFQPPGSGNVTSSQAAIPFSIEHPYQMAQRNASLNDNMIIRPMCYDAFKASSPPGEPTLMQWLRDIIAYAKSCGIVPAGFQIGLKTFKGGGNHPPNGYDASVDVPQNVVKRCVEILRPSRIGLIIFALSAPPATSFLANVAKYNFALNGVAKSDGAADFSKFDAKNPSAFTILPNQAVGPIQVPLHASGVARVSRR